MPSHRRLLPSAGLTLALLLSVTVAGTARSSQALFSDTELVGANALSTGVWVYYLHNSPTPPTGNTSRQADLTMDGTAPTATTLYNYDADANADPGRTIARNGSGAGEANLARYQNWRTPVLSVPLHIDGTVELHLWSAVEDFHPMRRGAIEVFLRDYNPVGGGYVEIGSTEVAANRWQSGSGTWVLRPAYVPVDYTVPAGHRLEVKVVVGGPPVPDMWFAYDTAAYPSRLILP